MAELKNRQWLLAARPHGIIKESDFRWNETAVPPLKDGQVVVRNLAFSFDPTQRGWMSMDTYMPAIPLGQTMKAATVGQVVESKKTGFAKGDLVQGLFGWEDYTVSAGEGMMGLQQLPRGTDPILALSLLGITGLTAYFGTLSVGAAKAGDTFVVSGAAGATGSVAGMIAKIKGCRVVGIAGGREKCDWLVKEAGFDAAIDYKNENVGEGLTKACPKGIDVYFDNVGGEILDAVLTRLARGARIVICGAVSQYNNTEAVRGPSNYLSLLVARASMTGMVVFDYAPRFAQAAAEIAGWMQEGRLVSREHIVEGGVSAFPETLLKLFSGENVGKLVLQVGSD